jgi:hypothetical protein
LLKDPGELLIRRWNWKSALYSSVLRASIFFLTNVGAGLDAAYGAMVTELVYRIVTAGFYGALTQSFRRVEPWWQGAVAAVMLLVGVSHTLELFVHWARGTPNLWTSIGVSATLTLLSTLFNLHVMRKGMFVTDRGARSLTDDFQRLPGVLLSFTRLCK